MVLRKTRTTGTGRTNADTRTAPETKPERKKRLPLHESSYPYHEAKLGVPRVKEVPSQRTDPIKTQQEFYKTSKKKPKPQATLQEHRHSALEGHNFFTGGDNEPYLHNAHEKVKSLELATEQRQKTKEAQRNQTTKEVEHKKATQETQLVHMAQKETLEGKVNLAKVADVRRAIRRRYANRTDFRKIFNQWDENSLGVLSATEVHRMMNLLGISVNLNEARVLVASADKNNSGVLDMGEFMNLIFDESDKLNVDLSKLKDEGGSDTEIIKNHDSAVQNHTQKIQNELKIFLQENIRGFGPQFLKLDKHRKRKVKFEQFTDILNNMDLPPFLCTEKNYKTLYEELGGDREGINYQEAVEKLKNFDSFNAIRLEVEQLPSEHQSEHQEIPQLEELTQSSQTSYSYYQKLDVLDRQKVPVNQLENIFLRARKVRQFLRENFSDKNQLQAELQELSGNKISMNQLKDFVLEKVQQQNTVKLSKKELEGFLSSYIYNKDTLTPTDEVVEHIFLEDNRAAAALHERKRAIPPVRETQDLNSEHLGQLKALLKDIEEKMFVQGKQNSLTVFKSFDKDADGYLTKEDISKGLELHQIVHSADQVEDFMAFLDENKNGYVDYSEFSRHVQPNIFAVNCEQLQDDQNKYLNVSQPSTKFLQTYQSRTSNLDQAHNQIKEQFKPQDTSLNLKPSTRFGAKPPHQNTFLNVVPPQSSGMFLSDSDRLNAKRSQPINIANEDKAKKAQLSQAKINYLQQTRQSVTNRTNFLEEQAEQLDSQKIQTKSQFLVDYENRCRRMAPFT